MISRGNMCSICRVPLGCYQIQWSDNQQRQCATNTTFNKARDRRTGEHINFELGLHGIFRRVDPLPVDLRREIQHKWRKYRSVERSILQVCYPKTPSPQRFSPGLVNLMRKTVDKLLKYGKRTDPCISVEWSRRRSILWWKVEGVRYGFRRAETSNQKDWVLRGWNYPITPNLWHILTCMHWYCVVPVYLHFTSPGTNRKVCHIEIQTSGQ